MTMINQNDTLTMRNLGNNGRLGNQMFQVASLVGMAESAGCKHHIPLWRYSVNFKNFPPTETSDPAITHIYHEPFFHYTGFLEDEVVEIIPMASRVIDVRGYFQSEKYWVHCKDKILAMFEFNSEIVARAANKLAKIIASEGGGCTFIGLHMRFGDYVNNPYYANLPDSNYYKNAVEHFSLVTRPVFLVFSDDPVLARSTMQKDFPNNIYYIIDSGDQECPEIDDLHLQSVCHHNIIANSSFSWWAAYLNKNTNKTVVAPKQWFDGGGLANNTKDLYTDDMILL